MINKFVVRTSVAVVAAAAAGAAMAQAAAPAAPEPPVPLSANLSLTTKYKFRGQDQGNTKWFSPAIQGGFDWTSNGFYLGNWNSNVSFSNAAIEMDFYGGYRGEITKGLGYDVGLLYYYYPQKDRELNFNTVEAYGALSWEFLTLKYSHTVSKDYFGLGEGQAAAAAAAGGTLSRPKGRGTGYIELNANFPIDKLTINAHIGYTRFASDLRNARATIDGGEGSVTTEDLGLPNYYDYKLGVTYDASALMGSGVSMAAAYVGASKKGFYGDINKARVILTLSKTF